MKILFLYPNHKGNYMLPPGIGILSACLKRAGHTVDLFDTTQYASFDLEYRPSVDVDKSKSDRLMTKPFEETLEIEPNYGDIYEDWENKVNSFKPDLIALSATEDLWLSGIELLKRVRHKGILHIAGGVFTTFAPDLAIGYPEIDIVCKGEGELALVELCNKLEKKESYDNVSNLWIKKTDGIIIKNPLSQVDMDDNPLIDVSLFVEARYYRPMAGKVYKMFPVEIFRGCPYKCTYCNSPWQSELYKNEANTNFLRRKSFDKIKEELDFYKDEMKAEYLYFWSDTFFSWKRDDFYRFCEIYEDIKLPFWIQTRPETIKFDLFKRLKEIGCHRISFGVEHGNYEFRKNVLKRRVTNKKIIESLQIVNEVGIPYSVNNVIGFPGETYELAFETIELNRKIAADDRNAYPFSPFHGVPLRKDCDRLGYTKDEDIVESMVASGSILDMPQFPKEKVAGLCKTFNLYVSFPKSRWPEIKKAEKNTTEGQIIYENLKEEFVEKYLYKDGQHEFPVGMGKMS
jgi:anaerobic magnesium-protoporphyrin IX monomethyl ester cyclase